MKEVPLYPLSRINQVSYQAIFSVSKSCRQLTGIPILNCTAPLCQNGYLRIQWEMQQPSEAPQGKGMVAFFPQIRVLAPQWSSSSLHLLFCLHRLENVCVGPRGLTWRRGYSGGGHHQNQPLCPLHPPSAQSHPPYAQKSTSPATLWLLW